MKPVYSILLLFSLLACQPQNESSSLKLPEISAPDGFDVTMLYSPSQNGMGSWVSLTCDDQGRLLASDQYGKIYRVTVNGDEVSIDSINLNIGGAQGLLWAHGGLYVTVNARGSEEQPGSGVYKLTDTDNDDQLDSVEKLVELQGEGEHGPHGIITGPDGETLYLIAGNHTLVPEDFTSILNGNWQEDRLYPSIPDPRGHANGIKPPGGWIARSNDRGKSWEVIASGFRNAYDIAFNRNGDLFTFDSDMEWDLGMPWYRPTRVCHVIPGAEFGWRTGSGKWPAYYPDNLPPVLNVGQGSPTGVTFGYGASFPEEYRNALFIADWSFGTIYQVELTPIGASYSAEKKEFLSGTPLAITDMVIAPDGNMYFTTGGRRGSSYLYRVSYTKEVTESAGNIANNPTPWHELMLSLQTADVDQIWESLDHTDRFVRYSARLALEKTDAESWKTRYLREEQPSVIIAASIAAARGNMDLNSISEKLGSIDSRPLSLPEKLDYIRAADLTIIRKGPFQPDRRNLPDFPSGNAALDRELAELLVYMGDKEVIAPTLDLMEKAEGSMEADLTPLEVLERSEQYGPVIAAMQANRPEEQGIALALVLSHARAGWTSELRERYFQWFYRAFRKSGGMSYIGFLEKIRLQALENVPPDERSRLAEISGDAQLHQPSIAGVPPPEGPGRNWTINEALDAVNDQLEGRDLKRGKELYAALLCASCHTMDGEGGNIGPDLTQAGSRFSNYDVLMAMISPSIAISDQYASTLYTLKNGNTLVGRAVSSTDDSVTVNINPYSNDVIVLARSEIASEESSPVSPMPAGLINQLNEKELQELMAYIRKNK